SKLRHALCEIAARLVAQRQEPVLDEPDDVLCPVAEVHDVPYVFDFYCLAQRGFEPIPHQLQRFAEACRARPVAAGPKLDWSCHWCEVSNLFGVQSLARDEGPDGTGCCELLELLIVMGDEHEDVRLAPHQIVQPSQLCQDSRYVFLDPWRCLTLDLPN